jgi:hypothetical protein
VTIFDGIRDGSGGLRAALKEVRQTFGGTLSEWQPVIAPWRLRGAERGPLHGWYYTGWLSGALSFTVPDEWVIDTPAGRKCPGDSVFAERLTAYYAVARVVVSWPVPAADDFCGPVADDYHYP